MIYFLITLLVVTVFGFAPDVNAASFNADCPSVYGAKCPTGQLFIDKKVRNSLTGEFVEGLSSSDPTYLADQEVTFRVEVKNNGASDLDNVKVQDKLPDFLVFVSGPGSYDQGNRTLNWTIDKLKANEFKIFEIKGKIASSGLPDMGISCVTNFVQTTKDQMNAQDSAVYCIQTKILGTTKELPKTGIGENIAILLSSISLLIFSAYLFKKA